MYPPELGGNFEYTSAFPGRFLKNHMMVEAGSMSIKSTIVKSFMKAY